VAVKNNVVTQISKADDIPAGKFDITEINFDRFNSTLPEPSDGDFQPLEGLRDLRRVFVRTPKAKLSDAAFAFLKGNDELIWVNLEGQPAVTDGVLGHLSEAKKLQFLGVQYATDFTGKELGEMPFLATLMEADFLQSGITDECVKVLATCKQLRRIRISSAKVTDRGLAAVAGLRELLILDVSNTQFGDEAAAAIAKMRTLNNIQAANTPLTDAGLEKLRSLKSLTTLAISGSKVTADGAAKFQKAMPQCRVSY
jgi:hypothetical protein